MRFLYTALCLSLFLPILDAQETPVVSTQDAHGGLVIETPYGDFILDGRRDRAMIEIIASEAFLRLKAIHQYGPSHYIKKNVIYGVFAEAKRAEIDYTRFDHSICVAMLARLNGRPLTEQIAGLLHDISHTALSHVGDVVFGANEPTIEAYQDTILRSFLEEHGIADILRRNRISLEDVLEKPAFLDRLDYTLIGGWLAGVLESEKIAEVVEALSFNTKKRCWFFDYTKIDNAREIAYRALELTEINHGAAWNTIVYSLAAQALDRAFRINLFSEEDFKYALSDDDVWEALSQSPDRTIARCMRNIKNHESFLLKASDDDSGSDSADEKNRHKTIIVTPKFRGFDPLIRDKSGRYCLLTQIDDSFRASYYKAEAQTKIGFRARGIGGIKRSPVLYGY